MQYVLIVIFGIISGILGGMGMGGGTLLIPLLGFLSLPQQSIQAANLISFIPMAAATLAVHKRNGLLNGTRTGFMIVPAVIFAVIGAFLSNVVESKTLKIAFGVLLLVLGISEFVSVFSKKNQAE